MSHERGGLRVGDLPAPAAEWQGPSSTAMAAAAQPYIGWLTTTSAQLQEAAARPPRRRRPTRRRMPPGFRHRLSPPTGRSWRRSSRPTSWARTPRRSRPTRPCTASSGRRTPPRCTATPPPRQPPHSADTADPAGPEHQPGRAGTTSCRGRQRRRQQRGELATLNSLLGNLQNAAGAAANPAASAAQRHPLGDCHASQRFVRRTGRSPNHLQRRCDAGLEHRHDDRDPATARPLHGRRSIRLHASATPRRSVPGWASARRWRARRRSAALAARRWRVWARRPRSAGCRCRPDGRRPPRPPSPTPRWRAAAGPQPLTRAPAWEARRASCQGWPPPAARRGMGLGGPRYGVKPKVMPKQVFV